MQIHIPRNLSLHNPAASLIKILSFKIAESSIAITQTYFYHQLMFALRFLANLPLATIPEVNLTNLIGRFVCVLELRHSNYVSVCFREIGTNFYRFAERLEWAVNSKQSNLVAQISTYKVLVEEGSQLPLA